jgi:hypothetical protein
MTIDITPVQDEAAASMQDDRKVLHPHHPSTIPSFFWNDISIG